MPARSLSARLIPLLQQVRLRARPKAPKAMVICHSHYPDVVGDLIEALSCLPAQCELHVTSSDAGVLSMWQRQWRVADVPLRTHIYDNIGRDIRPFFELLRSIDLQPGVPILKLHGKKSSYSDRGGQWRNDLLRGLLPSRKTVQATIDLFAETRSLGMIGPPGSYISAPVYWGENRPAVRRIMKKMFEYDIRDDDLGFFAGSMFWVRSDIILQMLPQVDPEGYEPEQGQRDGTLAHALERLVPMVASKLGYLVFEGPMNPEVTLQRALTYY